MTVLKQPLSKLRAKSVSGPRVLIVVASVVTILITLVEMFRGALTVGISTDAPESIGLLSKSLGEEWEKADFDDRQIATVPFTRGNAFQIIAHALNVLRGNETWSQLRISAETIAVQNLAIGALALLTFFTVGFTTWLITSTKSSALFASGVLAATPVFVGHSVMNQKDIPAAAGFTFVLAGCVLAFSLSRNQQLTGARIRAITLYEIIHPTVLFIFVFVGVWLGVGTRTALWLPLLLLLVFTGVTLRFCSTLKPVSVSRDSVSFRTLLSALALGAIGSFVAVGVSHPQYVPYARQWLSISISSSTENPLGAGIGSLVAGQRLSSNDLPWWYLPAWVGASIPLLLIVFIALGTGIGLWKLLGRSQDLPSRASYGLVLAQAYALPLAAVVAGSVMYNAQRHHLYMYPALAVLAGVGLKWLLDKSNQSKSANSARVWQWVIAGTAAFALLYPTIERLRLHPYEYTYLNEVATIGGINGRWETDYYNASLREAITRVPPDLYPYFYAPPENMDTYFYLRGLNYDPKNVASEDEYWRINVTVSGREMPGNCRDVDSVTRNFRGENVVMSWVGICKKLPGGPSETQ